MKHLICRLVLLVGLTTQIASGQILDCLVSTTEPIFVGDRVELVTNVSSNTQLIAGSMGTVLCGGVGTMVMVEWDNVNNGSDGSGICQCGDLDGIQGSTQCWGVSTSNIVLSNQFNRWTVNGGGGVTDFDTIQEAINFASDGDEVAVFPGTYRSARTSVVSIGNSVRLFSVGGPGVTVIYGNNVRRGIVCRTEASIEGFYITDCLADVGAGISTIEPIRVVNCILENNAADTGGGIFTGSTNVYVSGCVFRNNSADIGAGLFLLNGTQEIINCSFENNIASYNGGGVLGISGNTSITDCVFIDNAAFQNGGGVALYSCLPTSTVLGTEFINNAAKNVGGGCYLNNSSPTMLNGVFTLNNAAFGGGIGLSNFSFPNINQHTITQNNILGAGAGGGIYVEGNSTAFLENTTVCDNTPDQILGDWVDIGGNRVNDVCPTNCPCDFDGNNVVDIFDILIVVAEYGGTGPLGDCNADGVVNVVDIVITVASMGPC